MIDWTTLGYQEYVLPNIQDGVAITGGWAPRLVGDTATFQTVAGAKYLLFATTNWVCATAGSGHCAVGIQVVNGSSTRDGLQHVQRYTTTNERNQGVDVIVSFVAEGTSISARRLVYFNDNGRVACAGTPLFLVRVG